MVRQDEQTQQVLSYVRHQAAKGLADLAALMERTGADCALCLEGVSDEQAAFRPGPEEWNIKEVLGHLLPNLKVINSDISGLVQGRPPKPAGQIGVTAGGDRHIDELRRALAEVWSDTVRLVVSLPEGASLEPTREHPWFGPLNFREWIAFQRVHTMDHVQQMEEIKAHPSYPKR